MASGADTEKSQRTEALRKGEDQKGETSSCNSDGSPHVEALADSRRNVGTDSDAEPSVYGYGCWPAVRYGHELESVRVKAIVAVKQLPGEDEATWLARRYAAGQEAVRDWKRDGRSAYGRAWRGYKVRPLEGEEGDCGEAFMIVRNRTVTIGHE
jgi:hypothetical protein